MIQVIAGFGIVILFLYFTGIGCPIKFFTGISCPGCGMTRACLSALELDLQNAFIFHPLFWVIPCYIIGYCFRNKLSKKFIETVNIILIIALISVYLIRMFLMSNDIVVFNPQTGFFYKIIEKIVAF